MSRSRRAVLTALVVVGALSAVLWSLDALAAEGALQTAADEVSAAQDAIRTGDTDRAAERLTAAREAVTQAEARTDGPIWWLGSRVPVAGRSAAILRAVVRVADAAVAVGEGALDRREVLLDADGDLPIRFDAGRLDLAALTAAAGAFDELPLAALEDAVDRLDATASTFVPALVRDARREVLVVTGEVSRSLRRVGRALDVLPTFLGADGPRRYFLAFQNPAELRATGGLVSLFGILTADDGRLTLDASRDAGEIAPQGLEYEPVAAPPGFHERYRHAWADGYLINTNVDPDLPTVAGVMLELYRTRTGDVLDGLITIDPVAMGDILRPVGPIDVTLGDATTSIAPADLGRVTLIDAYETFDGRSEERDAFLAAVADAAFGALLAGGWDAVDVGRAIGGAAAQRRLQLYSTRAEEQEAFGALGVDGRLGATPGTDTVALTANNTAGNKMDVHVAHRIEASVRLEVDGSLAAARRAPVSASRELRLSIEVENPLPTSGLAEAIIGSIPTAVSSPNDFTGPPGLARTWFTVWVPQTTTYTQAQDGEGATLPVGTGVMHGFRALDHYLETPSLTSRRFTVDAVGPVELDEDGGDLVYRFRLRRQPKAIPDSVAVEVFAPPGWSVVAAEVLGGGTPGGMGLDGDGAALTLEVVPSRARVDGTVTADVTLDVRFSRGLGARLVDWLRAPL